MPAWGHVIDVPIEDTGYIIRQTLADQVVALPQTVQLFAAACLSYASDHPAELACAAASHFFLLSGADHRY